MAMTTRCPHCGTAFKVVPDQLRVRNGLVRCGACGTVFDGRACLMAQIPQGIAHPPAPMATVPPAMPAPPLAQEPAPAAAPVLTQAPAPVAAPPSAPTLRPEPVLAAATPAVLRGRPEIRRHDPYLGQAGEPGHDTDADDDESIDEEPIDDDIAATQAIQDEPVIADRPVAAGPAEPSLGTDEAHVTVQPAVLGEARTRYFGATDVGRSPPEFLDTDQQERRRWVGSLWGYACVVGLLLLAVQLVYVYRSAIATSVPGLRPLMVALCEPLGCQVGYARRIERIFITSSSLQPPRGQAGAAGRDDLSRLVLRLTLRNRYDKPQHWPALLLDLTDLSDTVVVRKVLQPSDYLSKERLGQPFEAGGEITVEVPIEVAGAHVNGYQLDKFFP